MKTLHRVSFWLCCCHCLGQMAERGRIQPVPQRNWSWSWRLWTSLMNLLNWREQTRLKTKNWPRNCWMSKVNMNLCQKSTSVLKYDDVEFLLQSLFLCMSRTRGRGGQHRLPPEAHRGRLHPAAPQLRQQRPHRQGDEKQRRTTMNMVSILLSNKKSCFVLRWFPDDLFPARFYLLYKIQCYKWVMEGWRTLYV